MLITDITVVPEKVRKEGREMKEKIAIEKEKEVVEK